MASVFRFKQFEIDQTNAPFKIGTDGLLLGAWATHSNPEHILDVGTGTGLIALMMAQRYSNSQVKAVEINPNAAEIAHSNFLKSPWRNRLQIESADYSNFGSFEKFDLIVSNPPFFSNSKLSGNKGKDLARHNENLNLKQLIITSKKLLRKEGKLAIIIPSEQQAKASIVAESIGLFICRCCKIKPTPTSSIKRVMLEFTSVFAEKKSEELVVEIAGRHNYSEEYERLANPFLLDKN